MNAVDQLTDIERHDYCHTDPAAEGDLITVRVTLDVVVSRSEWDADWQTGTDPQMVRADVQRKVKALVECPTDDDPLDPIRTVTVRRFAGVEVAKRFDRGRRR